MVKEEFGKVSEILTVNWFSLAINFEDCYFIISVNFITWWVSDFALCCMSFHVFFTPKEAETVMTDKESVNVMVLLRVWAKVPGFALEFSDLDPLNSLDLSCLLMHGDLFLVHTCIFIIFEEASSFVLFFLFDGFSLVKFFGHFLVVL